jgi:hypothetical protein
MIEAVFQKNDDQIDPDYLAFEEYLTKLPTLKDRSAWEEILELGKKALYAGSISKENQVLIHMELASVAFYLDCSFEMQKHLDKAKEIAESLNDFSLITRSYYLQSAQARALGDKELDPTKKDLLFLNALNLSQKAWEIVEREPDTLLKGKVLFNMGAAHADNPKGDPQKALAYYDEAMKIFDYFQSFDDYARMAIRKINLLVLLNPDSPLKARGVLEDCTSKAEGAFSDRTRVHYLLAEARVCFLEEKKEDAFYFANQALQAALELKMTNDVKRINGFLQNLG